MTNTLARPYYTLAVLPKSEGNQWSPQFGDYSKAVVAQELEDTRSDWSRGSRFKIIKTSDNQRMINEGIDQLNAELMECRKTWLAGKVSA